MISHIYAKTSTHSLHEISEWGVDHIGGVDFDDPEVNRGMMNAFFASFGCTPDNPHPAVSTH